MADEMNNIFNEDEEESNSDTTVKFEPLTSPENVVNNSSLLMKRLADNASLDGIEADGGKLLDRTKLFVIAQAHNELNRVIKMTNLLDKIEAKFIDAIEDRIEQTPDNLQLLTYAMETISNSLTRSNQIITQVLKDDKLAAIVLNTTNIITPDGNSATILSMDSRDAIRNWASSTFDMLKNLEASSTNSVPTSTIDVPEEEIKEASTNE